MSEDKKVYELGFNLISTLPEGEVPTLFEKIRGLLKTAGGEVISEESPKLRPLAYEMRKKLDNVYRTFDSAYFGWFKFEGDGETAVKVKNLTEVMPEVLRSIVIKTVRENTMIGQRLLRTEGKPVVKRTEVKNPEEPKVPVSEAELDKSIAELVS